MAGREREFGIWRTGPNKNSVFKSKGDSFPEAASKSFEYPGKAIVGVSVWQGAELNRGVADASGVGGISLCLNGQKAPGTCVQRQTGRPQQVLGLDPFLEGDMSKIWKENRANKSKTPNRILLSVITC